MFQSREQVLGLVGALVIGLLLVAFPPARAWLEEIETGLYDVRMGLITDTRPVDSRVRVMGIDGPTRTATKGWDAASAEAVLGRLAQARARAVYLMELPAGGAAQVEKGLAALPAAAARAGAGTPQGLQGRVLWTDLAPSLDEDGILRRPALAARDADGGVTPSAALYLLAAAEGVAPADIHYGDGSITVGSREIPVDGEFRTWLQFRLPMHAGKGKRDQFYVDPLQPTSARKLLDPESPVLGAADGALFLIGDQPEQALQEVTTSADKMTFLEAEANMVDSLLGGAWFRRPSSLESSALVLGICLFLGVVLPRIRTWLATAVVVLGCAVFVFVNVSLFGRFVWLDLAAPLMAAGLVLPLVLALQFARSSRLLGQFLAPEMAQEILKGQQSAALGGQEKVCTILFYSLPGCLKSDGGMSVERRNEYTHDATDILVRHGGRVMDYQGDAQMVLFGAPREIPNHAAAAVAAALDLHEMNTRLMAAWDVEDPARAKIHAGVCTGPLAVGFVGSEGHKEFAAIGDTTNVAARLYVAAIKMGIPVLVAGTTMEASRGAIEAEPLPPVELKGKSQPVPVFRATSVAAGVGGAA